MPTSAAGSSERRPPGRPLHRPAAGFTLLELLLVIALAGILLATVTLSVAPDERAELERDARRVGDLLAIAAEESRLRNRRIVWEADLAGFRFVLDDGSARTLIVDDELLRERRWSRPLTRLARSDPRTPERSEQVVLAAGADPLRIAVTREWVQPPWRLELAHESARVALDFDEAGRATVAR